MGVHQPQKELFSYQIDLDKRVRADHPLRAIRGQIDFEFIRAEVADRYGDRGNVSIDPAIILKMMFLLFYDNVASERELMSVIGERMDYLWFLGYGLEDKIPDHSVLSKARKRWGKEAFESFFVRTVVQCLEAGLVEGKKVHMDASLIDANASKDSVVKSSTELIAAVKKAYQAQESKLEDVTTPGTYEPVNDRMMSTSDPDAPCVRKGSEPARPRYHHHRVVDDAQGVITAVETTPGSITENKKLLGLIEQHQANTSVAVQTVVADSKYGTTENFIACQQQGIKTHMADMLSTQKNSARRKDIFPESAFVYQSQSNSYLCPAGQELKLVRFIPERQYWEYQARKRVCAHCPLRDQCTQSRTGRTLKRYKEQALLDQARVQSRSAAARRDRHRRQVLAEGSFADAANNHGFKRSRWRRLWRQQIQDWMIAAIQNIRILLKHQPQRRQAQAAKLVQVLSLLGSTLQSIGAQRFREFPEPCC